MKKISCKNNSKRHLAKFISLFGGVLCLALSLSGSLSGSENLGERAPLPLAKISEIISKQGNLAASVSYRIDSSGKLTLNDIIELDHDGKLSPTFDKHSSLTYPDGAIWLRLRLFNDTDDSSWYITTLNDRIKKLDVYYTHDGKERVHELLGLQSLKESTSSGFNNADFRLDLAKNQGSEMYLRIESKGVFRTNLYLLNQQQLWENAVQRTIFVGIYSGIILSLVIYNLFLYFSLRDKSYLHYIYFSICMLLLTITYHAIPDRMGLAAPCGLWIDHIETIRTLPIITGALFITSFFRLKQNMPRFNRLMISLIIATVFAGVISVLGVSAKIAFVIDLLNMLTLTAAIATGFLMLKFGYLPARYFLVSWIIFGLGVFIWLLCNWGLIPAYFFIRQAPQLAGVFEIIFMSLALAERLRHFDRLTFDLEQKNKENERTRRFIHILFHDLANPLAVVIGLIELLKGKCVADMEKTHTYFQHITNALETMKETIDGVRTLESLRSYGHLLTLENVDVVDSVQKSLDIYEEKLQKKSLTIIKDGFEGKMINIKANIGLFKNEIIGNLISNAIKFSYRSGIIRVSIRELDDEVQVIVADEGIGISPNILSSIFEPRLNSSQPGTEDESGSGYGMPIVKESVAYCGGRIEVESSDKESSARKSGTTFSLFFKKA